uniref:Ig-like domain-containing protein n=1 Tax=Cyprinus carpio TaxID=7962 RepID=A0A8C2HF73_CYPCA
MSTDQAIYVERFKKMINALILFSLVFCHLLGVFVAETNGVKSLSVMEGDTLILESNVTEIQTCDEIEWTFGNIRIARIKRVSGIFSTSYEDDLRFIDARLQLDNQTGSLTITNTRSVHTGVYELTIMVRNVQSIKSYSVTVYALLPIPVIFIDTLPSSSSSERSSRIFLCSVVNVRDATLSWYKGNSLLSSINVSDLSISLSLPLEVEYQEKNTYSCVVNDPFRNQTTHLDITDFYLISDSFRCCYSVEAVIRLVVTAVVGVAAVAAVVVLVYDIKSRTGEKRTDINIRH